MLNERLLRRIYDLNLGLGDWTSLLDELGQYLEASAAAVMMHNFAGNHGFIYAANGYNLKDLNAYAVHHAQHNPWLAHESDYRPAGKIHLGDQLVLERQLMKTEFYFKWLRPQDLHHRLCMVLSRAGANAVFLEVMRPRTWSRFGDEDIERCRLLLPHLQRALHMHRRMADLETQRDAALDALDRLPWGVVLVDNHGTKLAANRRAQDILLAGDGLVAHGDALRASLADENARFTRLLSSALNGTADHAAGAGNTLSITRPSKGRPLSVLVVPLRTRVDILSDRVPAAAIFVSDPDTRPARNEEHLRQLYALTAVEARMAAWLLQGKSIDEAAAAMGVKGNTARAYMKRIYNKTGVHRQSELIRLLLLGLFRFVHNTDQTTG